VELLSLAIALNEQSSSILLNSVINLTAIIDYRTPTTCLM